MKCIKCGKGKNDSSFPWRSKTDGTRHLTCKKCQYKYYGKAWYERNKEAHLIKVHEKTKLKRKIADVFIRQYLSTHPCIECGESDPIVLTFDHLDPATKRKDISIMRGYGYALKTIQTEIEKCQVLCFNCHLKKHRKNHTRLPWSTS